MDSEIFLNSFVIGTVLFLLIALMMPRVSTRQSWRAVVTPLASIIGSGFLILGPILIDAFGAWSPLAMAGLCAVAWAFGGAIRFNIAALDRAPAGRTRRETLAEDIASWVLAFAYVVSVAYYLNLFGAFAARATGLDLPDAARWITSAVFMLILLIGGLWGFGALERSEQLSVSLKLAIIAGLLAGLAWTFGGRAISGDLVVSPAATTGWPAVTLLLGLLITVQGFETSRYLGEAYGAGLRIRSMAQAQGLSTLIYLAYIGILAVLFAPGQAPLSETGVIDMMSDIAPVLPPLLIVAALSAQFSAAVADTSGSGGLFAETSRRRISERAAYAQLVLLGLLITWTLDVFQIIAYASRAFAAYYAIQAALAALAARREGRSYLRQAMYWALALLGLAIVLFGQAVE